LVDRAEETQPRQPSATPDTSDLVSSGDSSHSYEVRSSPAGGSFVAVPRRRPGSASEVGCLDGRSSGCVVSYRYSFAGARLASKTIQLKSTT
jgi:hypothetical protein